MQALNCWIQLCFFHLNTDTPQVFPQHCAVELINEKQNVKLFTGLQLGGSFCKDTFRKAFDFLAPKYKLIMIILKIKTQLIMLKINYCHTFPKEFLIVWTCHKAVFILKLFHFFFALKTLIFKFYSASVSGPPHRKSLPFPILPRWSFKQSIFSPSITDPAKTSIILSALLQTAL